MKSMKMLLLHAVLVLGTRVTLEPDAIFGETTRWHSTRRAKADHQLEVTVALKHAAKAHAKLEEHFWAVSDPDGPRYGAHLQAAEVTKLIGMASKRLPKDLRHRPSCTRRLQQSKRRSISCITNRGVVVAIETT